MQYTRVKWDSQGTKKNQSHLENVPINQISW